MVRARSFDSGFELSHDTYNGLSVASDGRVYYVLCSESVDTGGQMFVFDPPTGGIRRLGDLTEACGEQGAKAIPQGKSHVPFFEADGKLYFATHVDFYTERNGRELMGVPPEGYGAYPGGHFLSYDMVTGKFEDLGKGPADQGILTMTMDTLRGRLYGLTWPNGYLLRHDLGSGTVQNLGPVSREGEAGNGSKYRSLCRAMVVNPDDGAMYLTNADGDILRFDAERNAVEAMAGVDLRKDYFGSYDPSSAGHMGYNWRQVVWHEGERAVYGVHGNSGYLFRFDPAAPKVEVLERITSEPSRRSGMFDMFYYGYLGFTLGPDGRTLFYLTGGPVAEGQSVERDKMKVGAQGEENLHLVTYDIATGAYADHGAIFFADGRRPGYVNSIAVGAGGVVYALSRITAGGRTRTDLIAIERDGGGV